MAEKSGEVEVEQTNPSGSGSTFCDDRTSKSTGFSLANDDFSDTSRDSPHEVLLDFNEIVVPKLPIEDDLELQLFDNLDIPQDILFPQELNLYLQEKIKSLSEEKSNLSRTLQERETEIQLLNARICDSPTIPLRVPVANDFPEATDERITDLSSRLRDVSAELAATRIRCAAAEQKLSQFTAPAQPKDDGDVQTLDGNSPVEPYKRGSQDYRALVDKIHAANAKLFDSRNQMQQLRNELKMAYKVLQSEVGENVPISALMSGAGGWRGRAQTIQVLQQRVADLTTKLRSLAASQRCSKQVASCDVESTECPAAESSLGSGRPSSTIVRRAALKEAQKEAENATVAATDAKKRLQATKARIHLLNTEAASLRTRLRQLLDKGRRDEEYISLLQIQAKEQASLLCEKEDALRCSQQQHENDIVKLKEELGAERQRCQQLSANLGEKDSRIHMLEERLWERRSESTTVHRSDDPSNSDTKVTLRSAAVAAAAAPECNHQHPDSDTLVIAERMRLLELVGVINGRLNAARKQGDLLQEALQRERQRTALLETRLSRVELDRVGGGSSFLPRNQQSRQRFAAPQELTDALTDKLQLAEEQILTLKTRVDTLEKEKEDDLRRFASALNSVTSRH